jgi:GNAT superfamily N-acetyltransferase
VAPGIFDLRERPQHAAAVAGRIWKAFRQHKGTPLAQIGDGLDALLKADGALPFALVAEIDGQPCGNALVIDNDEPARPDLTPWLAALWVDEAVRGRGIAGALLDEAARRCAAPGPKRLRLTSLSNAPALPQHCVTGAVSRVSLCFGAVNVTMSGIDISVPMPFHAQIDESL